MPLATSPTFAELAERLGVRPLPSELVEQALTHDSYLNEAGVVSQSNERLEFVGDALLGFVIAHELFRRYPTAGEGELTRMRADIVRGSTLAAAAVRLSLGQHMILGRGEEAAGGRTRERNLAGVFEAMVGAVYRDQGYRAGRSLVLRLLGPELETVKREGARLDAKSRLQHLVQARWHQPPVYVTVEEESGGVGRSFTVEVSVSGATLGRGTGSTKREAQQRAAAQALEALSGEAGGERSCT